jgi:hypothetical protein
MVGFKKKKKKVFFSFCFLEICDIKNLANCFHKKREMFVKFKIEKQKFPKFAQFFLSEMFFIKKNS